MNPTLLPDDDALQLDADLIEALCSAPAFESPPAAVAARIKRSLLSRIAEAEASHLTVAATADDWRDFLPGVQIKVLNEAQGVMSYLLKIAAGASVPAHRHPCDEECVVLEGVLRIGALTVAAGGYHLARRDALHAPLCTDTGSTIFLRGAVPSAEQLI